MQDTVLPKRSFIPLERLLGQLSILRSSLPQLVSLPGFWPTENLNLPEAYSRRRAFHTSGGNPFLGILGSLVIRFLSRAVERELYRFARMPRRHATPINNNSFQISRACSNYPSKCSISVPNVPNVSSLGNKGRGRARARMERRL